MSGQEVKVSDKNTFVFWKDNFTQGKKSVPIGEFATAFVKRFQNGEDGYPKYPSFIIYRIIDHFIARKDDLSEASEISADDLARFTNRFGALPTAIPLVAENFLDPHGEVHKWYHFEIKSHVLDRKLMTEKNDAWLLRDSGSQPGDFVLVLRKSAGGKKEILVEHNKDKESGKMKYGCRSSENDDAPASKHGELKPISTLISFLHDRTQKNQKFTPICSQLFLGTHADFAAMDHKDDKDKADKDKADKEHEKAKELSYADDHKGYVVTEKTEISFIPYSTWAAQRAERFKIANNRYKNWQAAFSQQGADGGVVAKNANAPASLSRYVAGLLITGQTGAAPS